MNETTTRFVCLPALAERGKGTELYHTKPTISFVGNQHYDEKFLSAKNKDGAVQKTRMGQWKKPGWGSGKNQDGAVEKTRMGQWKKQGWGRTR